MGYLKPLLAGAAMFFLIPYLSVHGQEPLMVRGKIVDESGPLSNAHIQITRDSTETDVSKTNPSGEFVFFLDYENQYVVDFSKEGYFTKTIRVDTRLPEKQDPNKKQLVSLDLELIVNVSSNDKTTPTLGEIFYDRTTKEFSYRSKYEENVVTNIKMTGFDYYNGPSEETIEETTDNAAKPKKSSLNELEARKVEFYNKIKNRRASMLKDNQQLGQQPEYTPDDIHDPGVMKDTTLYRYSHHGMHVTEVIITTKKILKVYHKVRHYWGGVFYFRNYRPITKSLFQLETK